MKDAIYGMTIFWPDWTPATDTTCWVLYEAGIWHIGPYLTRVQVCAAPETPLTPEQVVHIRDEKFTQMRQEGQSIIPQFRPGYEHA